MTKKSKKARSINLVCNHDPRDPAHLECKTVGSKNTVGAVKMSVAHIRTHRFVDGMLIGIISVLIFTIGYGFVHRSDWGVLPLTIEMRSRVQDWRVGEDGSVDILYANNTSKELKDLTLVVRPSPDIEVKNVDFPNWNSIDNRGAISVLPAHSVRAVSITVKPRHPGSQTLGVFVLHKTSKGEEIIGSAQWSFRVPDLTIPVQAYVRYFSPEGEQVGRGPLPPEAGKETRYQVVWIIPEVHYSFHDVVMEGRLSEGVVWTKGVPLGSNEVQFDPLTRIVSWNAGSLTPETLQGSKGIIFEVAIRPGASSRGQIFTIVDAMYLRGYAQGQENGYETSLPPLTTELIRDIQGAAKGANVQ